jgi:predicted negative regulator of RcsB-dependent stress response
LRGKLSRGIRASLARRTRCLVAPQFFNMPTVSSSLPDPVLESHVFWERHKKEVVAALVIALLALAGYGGYRLYAERHNSAAAALLASAKTEADYQKVITQFSGTPASASSYIFLASEQRKAKKYEEANATLQSFVTKNPKHDLAGTARMAMAANLESLGKRDEALTMYQRIAADNPQGFTAPIALISTVPILKEKNQIEEARRVCETILTQYRDSAISMEATQQLRLLKVVSEPAKVPTPPTAPTAATPAPAVSATVASSPAASAVQSAAPSATPTPPAPSSKKPAKSAAPKKP